MSFLELAKNRYSERFFDSRPVEDAIIRQVMTYNVLSYLYRFPN